MPSTAPTQASRVLAEIDPEALARDCLAFLKVRSETGQEQPGAELLADLMRQSGWEVCFDEAAPGRSNVVAHLPGQGGGPSLLFNGHVDTIPVGQSWPPRREGEQIWGRGAEDCKGGLVAMVHAIRALDRAGVRLRGDLWLTAVVGHETPIGQKEGPLHLIRRIREGALRPDAILIVEGPPAIWSMSLGSTGFSIILDAGRPPIHTIHVPFKDNPVRHLARLIDEIDRLDERLSTLPPHPLGGRDRVNLGIASAGDYPNRLPVRLVISGTRRWTPGHTVDEVRAELEEIGERVARAGGLRSSVVLTGSREPFETPASHPLVQALLRAGELANGQAPEIVGMGLVGDANLYVNATGVPTVYYGPAYETAHSDAECVSAAQLANAARIYALAAMGYCGAATSGAHR